MKNNIFELDNEDIPIKISDNIESNSIDIISPKKPKKRHFTKRNIIFFFVIFIILILIYLADNNHTIEELYKKIDILESKIEKLDKDTIKKKIGIAIVTPHLFGNGIARQLTILSDLLIKTGKYNVYIINEKTTDADFKYNKKIKREIQKKDEQIIRDFDEENDIQIYILNNDVSDIIDIYHSLGKKVIGIFHGVYISCVFTDDPIIYRSWYLFEKYDSFIHIIPDDYWIYQKLGFKNNIFIPNLYTFDYNHTPSSLLSYKNVLMVGRVDDIIKGGKYGILAMSEILKEIPDAQLNIVSPIHPKDVLDLVKQLKIENNTKIFGFRNNISELYLNASVLLVTSISESFPMVTNEAKAHGLPIIAFDIDYCPCFQKGVIKVDMFNYTLMAREAIKLLKNYEYRKKMGNEAKLSLNDFNNNNTVIMWDKLFNSLINGTESFEKFQKEVKEKYYNEKIAESHIEKHYKYGQQFNEHYKCHTLENFTNLNYIKNIEDCLI